jgi:hypothetical protein
MWLTRALGIVLRNVVFTGAWLVPAFFLASMLYRSGWHQASSILFFALLTMGVPTLFVLLWSLRYGVRKVPAVVGHTGVWGSGKTLQLTADVLDALHDRRCLGVFTTWHVRCSCGCGRRSTYCDPTVVIDRILEVPPLSLAQLRAGCYLMMAIDEAGLILPSRAFDKLPPAMLAVLATGRHSGWVIRWAAQAEARVDKTLREITVQVWRWRAVTVLGYLWLVRGHAYRPGDADRADGSEFSRRRRLTSHIKFRWQLVRCMRAFDTHEEMTLARHLVEFARVPATGSGLPPLAPRASGSGAPDATSAARN